MILYGPSGLLTFSPENINVRILLEAIENMEGGCFIYLLVLCFMILNSVLLSRRSEGAGKNIFYYTVGLGTIGGVLGIFIIEGFGGQGYASVGVYAFVVLTGIIITTFGTWLISGFPPQ